MQDLTFELNESKQKSANSDLENLEISRLQKELEWKLVSLSETIKLKEKEIEIITKSWD